MTSTERFRVSRRRIARSRLGFSRAAVNSLVNQNESVRVPYLLMYIAIFIYPVYCSSAPLTENVPGDKHPEQPTASGGERAAALETIGPTTQDGRKRAAGSLTELESECVEISPVLDQRGRRGRLGSGSCRGRRTALGMCGATESANGLHRNGGCMTGIW